MIVTESTTGGVFESATVQVNVSVAVAAPSETVTVTLVDARRPPPIVPLMAPVDGSIEMPAGRPVAL